MPWARAVVNVGLGAALIDYWALGDLEFSALVKASRGELTEAEEAAEEKLNQQKLADALTAAFGPPKKPNG